MGQPLISAKSNKLDTSGGQASSSQKEVMKPLKEKNNSYFDDYYDNKGKKEEIKDKK